jgi:hypothetical protein
MQQEIRIINNPFKEKKLDPYASTVETFFHL